MPDASPKSSIVELGSCVKEFEDLVSKLDGEDLRNALAGDSSDVSEKILMVKHASTADAWGVFKLVHLLNAAAHLAFPIDRIAVVSKGSEPLTHESGLSQEVPSLLDILRIAREREQIRKAICYFKSGGPEGLFDAYEALSYELMSCGASDYARDVGTREWLAENGWATEEEIDRLLETVLCARGDLNSPAALESMSPSAAQELVRRLLLKFIHHSTHAVATSSDAA